MRTLTKDITIYKEKLLSSFPVALGQDVEKVVSILPFEKDLLFTPDAEIIHLENEVLKIPYRVYFDEPNLKEEQGLTDLQKAILNCIYLRHHSGFVRQKRLEQLIDKEDYFIIPYTFQLLGEYVIEILEVLEQHIKQTSIDLYVKFINENLKCWAQTQSRVTSYWNEYYRSNFPKFDDYIGKQIVDRLKKANAQQCVYKIVAGL